MTWPDCPGCGRVIYDDQWDEDNLAPIHGFVCWLRLQLLGLRSLFA